MSTLPNDDTPEEQIANFLVNLNRALWPTFANDVAMRREILAHATPVITAYYLKGQ
jgi:hypothetical protein